ncbi:MAG: DinB family protein [Anaerolineales bacterium]|nr:MAG: DinB family protein [Anaerolineales bacterium]
MDFRELFLAQHARAHSAEVGHPDFSVQDLILRDLTDEHLRVRPLPGLNSLAWLLWHMTRAEDVGINLVIAQRAQVLDGDGWAAGLNVSLRDVATGMIDQEVEEFSQQVNIPSLLAYRSAVGRRTQAVVRDLQPEVLDDKIDGDLLQRIQDAGVFGSNAEWVPQRWLGKPKGFTLMHTVLAHTYIHLGQCEDIRGLLGFRTL